VGFARGDGVAGIGPNFRPFSPCRSGGSTALDRTDDTKLSAARPSCASGRSAGIVPMGFQCRARFGPYGKDSGKRDRDLGRSVAEQYESGPAHRDHGHAWTARRTGITCARSAAAWRTKPLARPNAAPARTQHVSSPVRKQPAKNAPVASHTACNRLQRGRYNPGRRSRAQAPPSDPQPDT